MKKLLLQPASGVLYGFWQIENKFNVINQHTNNLWNINWCHFAWYWWLDNSIAVHGGVCYFFQSCTRIRAKNKIISPNKVNPIANTQYTALGKIFIRKCNLLINSSSKNATICITLQTSYHIIKMIFHHLFGRHVFLFIKENSIEIQLVW